MSADREPDPASPLRAAERGVQARSAALAELDVERERIFAILGGAERRGQWEPAPRISVFAFWGGVRLDFRDAALAEGETVLEVFAVMGGVHITVPRDIDVEVEGSGVMGGFKHLSHRADGPDAPLLRIRGLALMGGVEVILK